MNCTNAVCACLCGALEVRVVPSHFSGPSPKRVSQSSLKTLNSVSCAPWQDIAVSEATQDADPAVPGGHGDDEPHRY